jgi:hypothetical protein
MRIINEIRKRYPEAIIATTVIITAVMLLGTTAISTLTTAESVFAYRNNQATSQDSDCGNGFEPTNVGCQNTASQIQGDKNTVALSAQQTFPPAAPQTCVGCFDSLSDEEEAAFEQAISEGTNGQTNTIEELCALLETLDPPGQENAIRNIGIILNDLGFDPLTVDNIIGCLRDALHTSPTP